MVSCSMLQCQLTSSQSRYMTQWGIKYESAKTLKEGIVRFKERLEKLKQTGRGSRESIVIVDVDGNERIPEAMLKRKNIRFIFICSKSLKQQFFQRNPDDVNISMVMLQPCFTTDLRFSFFPPCRTHMDSFGLKMHTIFLLLPNR